MIIKLLSMFFDFIVLFTAFYQRFWDLQRSPRAQRREARTSEASEDFEDSKGSEDSQDPKESKGFELLNVQKRDGH